MTIAKYDLENVDAIANNVAHVCHEANRAYCQTLGDNSQPAWADAPDWQKQSAIMGVNAYLSGMHAARLLTPEDMHKSWTKVKEADGWVYGAIKDPIAKTHPCMVPYAQLPAEQRRKDSLFSAICLALLNSI